MVGRPVPAAGVMKPTMFEWVSRFLPRQPHSLQETWRTRSKDMPLCSQQTQATGMYSSTHSSFLLLQVCEVERLVSADSEVFQSVRDLVASTRAKQLRIRKGTAAEEKERAALEAEQERCRREAARQEHLGEFMALAKLVPSWQRALKCACARASHAVCSPASAAGLLPLRRAAFAVGAAPRGIALACCFCFAGSSPDRSHPRTLRTSALGTRHLRGSCSATLSWRRSSVASAWGRAAATAPTRMRTEATGSARWRTTAQRGGEARRLPVSSGSDTRMRSSG